MPRAQPTFFWSAASLGAVLRPTALPLLDARGVKRAAHDVVSHARKVGNTAASDKDDRVFLQSVPLARDVGGYLQPVRQANARHLAKGGIWLLWGNGPYHRTYTTLLWCATCADRSSTQPVVRKVQGRRLDLLARLLPTFPNELIDRWHNYPITY